MVNKKRLIDARGLVIKLAKRIGPMIISNRPAADIYKVMLSCIADAPTVDAVEVVRCKDCHWWRLINKRNGCGICSHEVFYVDDPTPAPVTEPDDFCSYGERREGE